MEFNDSKDLLQVHSPVPVDGRKLSKKHRLKKNDETYEEDT